MKLAIISHTEHYKTQTGSIVGWGPTITEINYLSEIFDEIYHIAMLYNDNPPQSALPYISNSIKFVPIKPLGGTTLGSKLAIAYHAPRVISTVSKILRKVDCFQLRTPTGIGVYLIPYLTFLSTKKGWFKYAGNWNQKNPPMGYRLQRAMLIRQARKVTINGRWQNQPKHCITFENPCLTLNDLEDGSMSRTKKSFDDNLQFCYVGRLERPKGVERIIKAFDLIPKEDKKRIGCVHLVGDGSEYEYFKELSESTEVPFKFHGFLSRQDVFNIYKKCHVFLMPTTASEGFPKVIAEAMNFGCLPIVSMVSSIGDYIKHGKNGFLLKEITEQDLCIKVRAVLKLEESKYRNMINEQDCILKKFTFSHYNSRILVDILN